MALLLVSLVLPSVAAYYCTEDSGCRYGGCGPLYHCADGAFTRWCEMRPSPGADYTGCLDPCNVDPGLYCDEHQAAFPCPTGAYCPGGVDGDKIACPEGFSSGATGASVSGVCTQCVAGTFAPAGSAVCPPCKDGTFSAVGASACTICPAGSYSAEPTGCKMCPAGTSSIKPASSACEPCSAGESSASGAPSCTTCPAGTINQPSTLDPKP